ncbi:JmjC domain-containing protein 4 [Triticum urartu]|uniref:JmjC domain-containing protein 4 n=2 Tax=Triticum TaxID=4564 RepID=M7YKE4_TRIUA|nr:JmjC domain-containing protein 4 [Triticum urartu]
MDQMHGGGAGRRVKVVGKVADCSAREYTDHKRLEMSMQEFVDHWVRNSNTVSSSGHCEASSLYLKDWHFVKEYPDYVAYTTPPFFVDDWLNMYLDSHPMHRDSDIANHKNEVNCADYRFVYIGAKGHTAGQQMCVGENYGSFWHHRRVILYLIVICRNLRSSVYDINEDVSEKQFPEFNKAEWIECIQEQNEIIFVPSGWYHQVYNLLIYILIGLHLYGK